MAKRPNDKGDWMSNHMDQELERIEKEISSLYSNAAKEVNAQLVKFTESYEKQLGAMQDKLEAGEISQSEYTLWVNKQMLQTDRYKATVDSMTNILTRSDKAAMATINGELPKVVAESYNFGQALGWKYTVFVNTIGTSKIGIPSGRQQAEVITEESLEDVVSAMGIIQEITCLWISILVNLLNCIRPIVCDTNA